MATSGYFHMATCKAFRDHVTLDASSQAVSLRLVIAQCGVAGGLPVGIQVVTAWWRDRGAIALAGHIGEVDGAGYRTPPGF